MSATPDPKTVREIAQQAMAEMAFRYDAVGSVLDARGLAYDDYAATVIAHIDSATIQVSWPHEQPQDADVQAARAWLADLSENIRSYHQSIPGQPGCTCGRSLACGNDVPNYAAIWILQAALDAWRPTEEDEQPQDERDGGPGPYQLRDLTDDEARELRARFEASEAAQSERDGDVRAVARWLAADSEDVPLTEWGAARAEVRERFGPQIAALEARDAKGGGSDG